MKALIPIVVFFIFFLVACYSQNNKLVDEYQQDIKELIFSTYLEVNESQNIEESLLRLTRAYLENTVDTLNNEIELCLFYNYVKRGHNLTSYFNKAKKMILKSKGYEKKIILYYLSLNSVLNFGIDKNKITRPKNYKCTSVNDYDFWNFLIDRDMSIFCLNSYLHSKSNLLLHEWLLEPEKGKILLNGMTNNNLMSLYLLDSHVYKSKIRFDVRKKILDNLDEIYANAGKKE